MALLQTDTLSNQNISSALLVATYTANAARKMFVRLFADQIAGSGDYSAYLTIQRAGAGSAYRAVPITTAAVASGVTSAVFLSAPFFVSNTDVVKVYLLGLAGDNTTPDLIAEWWEEVQQTGDSYARLGAPAGASVSADITTIDDLLDTEIAAIKAKTDNLPASPANEATLTTIAGYIDTEVAAIKAKTDLIPASPSTLTAAQVDTQLSASHGAGTWGAGGNGGALTLTYTLTSSVDSAAIQGATIELYAEVGMVTLIDSQVTNALGQCTFSDLVAGTYYLKRIKSGWSFGNPDVEVVA